MSIKQVSVFMENKPGKLSEIVELIAANDINLRAMSLSDTKDFGILRVISSDTDKLMEVVGSVALATVTDVVAVEMPDEVGALSKILKLLTQVNLEYMYAFTSDSKQGAYTVLRVDEVELAEQILTEQGISVLSQAEI